MHGSIFRTITFMLSACFIFLTSPFSMYGQDSGTRAESFGSSALYGYVETGGTAVFDGADVRGGFSTALRLKGEWQGKAPVTVRMELVYREVTGVANSLSLLNKLGMNPAPELQVENPQDSFLESIGIDHAWATAGLGMFDFSFGKMPLVWGTAWLYNPTDRLGAAVSLAGRNEETAGTTAFVPVFYPGGCWAVEGTVVFRQRGIGGSALTGSMDPENLPLGLRIRGYAAGFDFSVSVIKEVWYTGFPGGYNTSVDPPAFGEAWDRRYFLGADVIGQIGPFGFYLEGTFDLDSADDLSRAVDLAAGVEINPGKLSLKAEYIRSSAGSDDTAKYNPVLLLSGRSFFLARNYLFLYAGRIFGDYLELTCAGILNLDDLSSMLTAEAVYPFSGDFELKVSGSLPSGKEDSEYALDFMNPELSISMKASF